MAIVSLSAELGCPVDETARLAAAHLHFRLITEFELTEALEQEFGSIEIPDPAWPAAVQSILCRLASEQHLLLSFPGCEDVFHDFQGILRVHLTAPESLKTGLYMIQHGLDRPSAKRKLATAERKRASLHAARFDAALPSIPDLQIQMKDWTPDQAAHLISAAADCRQLTAQGFLTGLTQFEFELRMTLASHGIAPNGQAAVKIKVFSHPSEQLFANLLDFYRIPWTYEPRSFPLQWNETGAVTEAFTPDFYLPESDLYVELTTMKQSLVTRKNRKVKLLKAIYPHIQIQIFYEKDFQDLVFKYGIRAVH